MLKTCIEHKDCVVIYDTYACPVCNDNDERRDEIKKLERALDEYEN